MEFNTTWSKLTGKPNEGRWSQVYDFKPENPEKLRAKGHLFAIISTKKIDTNNGPINPNFEGVNQILLGKEVLTRLHEEYFGKDEQNPLLCLKHSVETIFKEFSDWEGVEIGTSVLIGNIIYLVVGGGSRIYILRDGVLSSLIKSEENSVRSASGILKDKDVLLIGTDSFFSEFAVGVLKALLQSESLDSFVDQLAPQIQSKENSGDIAACAIKFEPIEPVDFKIPTNASGIDDTLSVHQGTTEINREEPLNAHEFEKSSPNQESTEKVTSNQNVFAQNAKLPEVKEKKGAGDFFKNFLKQKLYVDSSDVPPEVKRKKKVSASVGLLLLIILLVSIFFGIRQKRKVDIRQSYEEDLNFAKHSLEESENLITLNPERARELFLQGSEKVLGISDIDNPEIKELSKKFDEARGKIIGEYHVNTEGFVDLSLLTEGFNGDEISFTDGILYILDKDGRKIVKVYVSSGRAEVVAGPGKVEDPITIAGYIDNTYLLTSSGVFELSGEKKEVMDEDLSDNILASAFAGNLYILERSTSMIRRFSGNGDVFGTGVNWLKEGTTTDLSKTISMAIDGNIWALTSEGDVYKFALGNPQNFSLSDTFLAGFKPVFVFTSDECNFLYFLDNISGKVFVFDKDGNYVSQYVNEEIKNTTKIAISEKEKKMVLLNGGKLFTIDLKHL